MKSLWQTREQLLSKQISSFDVTNHCLKQIKSLDEKIGCFLVVDEQAAILTAKASDERRAQGQKVGLLEGIPVALKDLIITKGLKTTAASRILENYVPPYDATVTRKLREAGAVILGKLNQDEFGMGSSNENSAYKPCHNPFDLKRTPGGSSGGSAAAVAAQMAFGTLGTDTGGSIRQPAAFCGIVGVKPTYGRVSRFGMIAFASSLDQIGPFAHDVRSAALLLEAIAGHDERDSTSVNSPVPNYSQDAIKPIKGQKIGIPKEYWGEGLNPEIRKKLWESVEALKAQGAQIIDVELPMTSYAVAAYYVIATAEASSNLARYDGIRFGPRIGQEEGLAALYERTRGELFGPEVKRRIMLGTYVLSSGYYDAYYLRAQKVRRLFSQDFARAFEKVDVLVCPTTPTTAFKLGEKVDDPLQMYLNDIYTISANLAGLPAMSVPIGLDTNGLPIGLQIMAKPFDESEMLKTGFAVEQAAQFECKPSVLS